MSVKIREKRGKLYLDIYHGGKRTWESLHLTLTKNKAQNKELMRIADICRSQRESKLLAGAWNIQDPVAGKKKLAEYLQERAEDYSSPGIIAGLLYHLRKFNGGDAVLLSQISPKWVSDFQKHLEKDAGLAQSSAAHHAKTLRATLKKAIMAGIITRNPAETVPSIKPPIADLVFLNIDELQRLAEAGTTGEDAEIRRAFLFACYTGLRVSDLETLVWGQIESNPMQVIKRQKKTDTPVYIPLNDTVKKIIDAGNPGAPDELVFNLPNGGRRQSYLALKRWAKEANIAKKVGWHTARRTFATLALENGAEIYTVAELLGHASISQVAKYAKVTDKLRREAVAALPEIRL
jgi:site-specific recombinase XerD